MEPIDTAYEKFCQLSSEMKTDVYWSSIQTEEDTRQKIIDRFFFEIFGWTHGEIQTEEHTGKGYLDYKLSINDISRIIVEAKRLSRDFDLDSFSGGKFYKLNGPVFKNKDIDEGIKQAITYAAYKGTELACVTNGKQWVIFLTRLPQTGREIKDGWACVFNGIEDIEKNFKVFFTLLAHTQVGNFAFRNEFYKQEKTPFRIGNVNILSPISYKKFIPQEQLHKDIDGLFRVFFQDIIDESDDNMLAECFVHSKESKQAEEGMLRLSEELVNSIQYLDSDSDELVKKVEDFSKNDFSVEATPYKRKGEIVLLAGMKGAGKSTFIKRFFKITLPNSIGNRFECFSVDLLGLDESHLISDRINSRLIEQLDERPIQQGRDAHKYIVGCFQEDYRRLSETTMKTLYETNKDAFKIEFDKKIEDIRTQQPHDYVSKVLNRIFLSEHKVPCVVIDNADHFSLETQDIVYQNAVALRAYPKNGLLFF